MFRPNGHEEDANVLCVSQLYHFKNIVELLRGFALAQLQGARLDLAGAEPDPAYSKQIRAEIDRLGLQTSVRLLGPVPYESLPALYARARIFAFPSTCESFPNILVEALASGAPVACSRVGPMPEICGEAARTFDPFDPEEIAARLRELWQDAGARQKLRQQGPVRAAQFTWDDAARGILLALEEAA
jgi:glycosyltransferase involved in cell wall biosynthesis